jgi:hypothetical protein
LWHPKQKEKNIKEKNWANEGTKPLKTHQQQKKKEYITYRERIQKTLMTVMDKL